jgi:hypothetical protein
MDEDMHGVEVENVFGFWTTAAAPEGEQKITSRLQWLSTTPYTSHTLSCGCETSIYMTLSMVKETPKSDGQPDGLNVQTIGQMDEFWDEHGVVLGHSDG